MRELLRVRRFMVPWSGQVVSTVGDAAMVVVLAFALAKDGPERVGVGLGAMALGSVVSLLGAGLVLDRVSDRAVVLGCDVVRLVATVLLWVGLTGDHWPLVLVAAATYGLGQGLYRPSYAALVMELAPETLLRPANKLRSFGSRAASLVGAPLGGLLVAVTSPERGLLLNATTYVVSMVTLAGVSVQTRQGEPEGTLWREATLGIRHVLSRRWQAAWILQGGLQVAGVFGLVSVALAVSLTDDSVAYGVVVGAAAGGALLGAIAVPEVADHLRGPAAIGLVFVQAVEIAALAASAPWGVLAVASVVNGYALSCFAVYWMTALQENTDREAIGRVLAVDALGNQALTPVGFAAAGFAVSALGVQRAMLLAAVVLAASLVPVLVSRTSTSLGYAQKDPSPQPVKG